MKTTAEAIEKFDGLPNNQRSELVFNFHVEKSKFFEGETGKLNLWKLLRQANDNNELTAVKIQKDFLFGNGFISWLTVNMESQLNMIELKSTLPRTIISVK